MLARQPLDKAIGRAKQSNHTEVVKQLEIAKAIRLFAVNTLSLPDNGSYRSYVPLKRRYPVWTVVAAEEFSVSAKNWCYLVIGCASYRGYFSREAAHKYAETLAQEGLETAVGGAAAYSTLGWFNDPLLPSMFADGEATFAETLFHELAHQVLYVNGDSDFNEAFASVVGEHGAKRWLTANNPSLLAKYLERLNAYNDFIELLLQTRERLARIYASGVDVFQMRLRKHRTIADLKNEYGKLKKERWQGQGWFDQWFRSEINNARLASVATYRARVPSIRVLLNQCDHDFLKFYRRLKQAASVKPLVVPHEC